ncbi:MAG: 6,7-dimethyl-8-ribityllumazine synthase [Bacteroidales bacterium]|jgi:6,7-dimethyl-8-ribityllumazine synthase|nr:6,7-dimethyl-8-ribityllumazine synthase [Bacteroidales bacterium]
MKQEKFALNLKNIAIGSGYKVAVITAEWNHEITYALRDECCSTLINYSVKPEDILQVEVPGTFELPTVAAIFASREDIDAVICLGCVIQGETRHFEFICNAVANGLTNVGIASKKPVIFGVLTTNTVEQAIARSLRNNHANKGYEAAISALKMLKAIGS